MTCGARGGGSGWARAVWGRGRQWFVTLMVTMMCKSLSQKADPRPGEPQLIGYGSPSLTDRVSMLVSGDASER